MVEPKENATDETAPRALEKLRYFLAEYDKIKADKKALRRQHIMDTDPNAPLCINCRFCEQSGFLFVCTIFLEDTGSSGFVYYKRKGHKPKTYPNVPLEREECNVFEPLIM